MADAEAIVVDGSRRPVTLIASGGFGSGNLENSRAWGVGLRGSRVCFAYTRIEPWLPGGAPRRGADRDATEALAVADQTKATRAVGMSRGAVAVLGVLAEQPRRFERVVFVIPPAGTSVGNYRNLLDEPGGEAPSADILILALRGDAAHPARVSEEWASRLRARLETFPSLHRSPGVYADIQRVGLEFLNQ